MARKHTAEIVAAVMQAFVECGTWPQAKLARKAGTSTEIIRRTLEDLQGHGWPLERQEELPQVYWSMPSGWLPGGIILPKQEIGVVLRLLARLPADEDRDRILNFITAAAPSEALPRLTTWVSPALDDQQAQHVLKIEESIRAGNAVQVRYLSTRRGTADERTISFQHITPGPHVRLCGHCHRAHALKWFRLDNVLQIQDKAPEAYVSASSEAVAAFMNGTVHGFHNDEDAASCSFTVCFPEARWVQQNLEPSMRAEPTEHGIRVHVERASRQQIARFVVSLGAAARPETEDLAEAVRALAEGALAEASGPR